MKASTPENSQPMNADDEQAEPLRYTFKPSVAGSPLTLELAGQAMSVHAGFRSVLWRYEDIARIRLTYRPVSMLAYRFRADIKHRDGRKLAIISASWAGIIALTPQNESYRAFIQELHRRISGARGNVVCLGGLHAVVFAMAAVVFTSVMLALAALLVRALTTGEHIAALFMLGFGAWSAWQVGGWLMRNKPQRYQPEQVPRELLP